MSEGIDRAFANLVEIMPGELSAAVEREFRTGFALEMQMAKRRQQRIAQLNYRRPRRAMEGMGQTVMCIDPVFRRLAEMQFGRDCWKDKGFRREILRDNPEVRVPYQKRTTSLRVEGRRDGNHGSAGARTEGGPETRMGRRPMATTLIVP